MFVILRNQNMSRVLNHVRRKRRGKSKMPEELIKEFIGKTCCITCMNAIAGEQGVIVAVENNWIKFQQKKNVRLLNGDMVVDIRMSLPSDKNNYPPQNYSPGKIKLAITSRGFLS